MRAPTFSAIISLCYILAGTGVQTTVTIPDDFILSGNNAAQSVASPWDQRRQKVVTMLRKCWESYRKDAFGADVYHPISHTGQWFAANKRGIGFTIADSLDTLLLAGLRTEYEQGREWIARNLSFNVNANVSLFETTIRVLGARELGDRLLPAYNTPSGIPYPKVNLATGKGSYYNVRGKVSLAEVGTLQLEMRELSRLTKDPKYWQAAKRADDVVAGMKTFDGLLPTTFKPPIPGFDMLDYTMGAVADSYYEYLLKRWLQSGKTDNSLRKRYDDAILGMRKHLIKVSSRNHYVFSGDLSDDGKFSPRMQHLTCFIGATLALGSVNGNADAARAKNDLTLAADITRTCNAMYTNMPTSLSPEFVYIREPFTSNINEDTNPVADNDMTTVTRANYNILRPETLESLFLMWYTTRDVKYREQAWAIFKAFKKHALTPDGNCLTSIRDVTKVPTEKMDLMESFLIAETFKYLLLIFDDNPNALPLDSYVLNTEAHPLPIFKE